MPAVHLRITGHVQGVFFRAHTKELADRLGITGWVRNEPNGSVLIHAEGTTEQLQEFEVWCRHGPPTAEVLLVTKEEGTVEGCVTFEILH